MAQSDVLNEDPFYSLGKRSLSAPSTRDGSNALRLQARKEAQGGQTIEVQPQSGKRFVTKSGKPIVARQQVKSANVVQKPLVVAPNPYQVQANSRKLQQLVANRAREMM